MSIKSEAIRLAKMGYRLIPIWSRKKMPVKDEALGLVSGAKSASSDVPKVSEWFSKYPNSGIAIACGGPESLLVIDADTPESLENLEQALFPEILPSSMVVKTRRGMHYYMRMPEGIKLGCSNSGLRRAGIEGIDVRGEGGMAIAPPSVHASGFVYSWLNGPVALSELPVAPAGLIKLLKAEPTKPIIHEADIGFIQDDSLIMKMASGMAQGLSKQTEGNRNSYLFWIGMRFHEAINSGVGRNAAERAWEEAIKPIALRIGLNEREIESIKRRSIYG